MPSDAHSTHRYEDLNGHRYICFDPMPRNLGDAITIAIEWAERTEEYILYSEEF